MEKARTTSLVSGFIIDSAFASNTALFFRHALMSYEVQYRDQLDALVQIFESLQGSMELNFQMVNIDQNLLQIYSFFN
jgi:hypothetical protein